MDTATHLLIVTKLQAAKESLQEVLAVLPDVQLSNISHEHKQVLQAQFSVMEALHTYKNYVSPNDSGEG